MSYHILGNSKDLYKGFGPREGLEGPFLFVTNKVLYYDNVEGQYYDPTTDFYVSNDEIQMLNQNLVEILQK